jgi:hypothetical protein
VRGLPEKVGVKVILNCSIDSSIKEKLSNDSKQSGISMSRIVTDALKMYLPGFEKDHRIQPTLE